MSINLKQRKIKFEPRIKLNHNKSSGILFLDLFPVKLYDFIHRLKSQNHLAQHDKQYHRKVLLSSPHLNSHTVGFISRFKFRSILYSSVSFIWLKSIKKNRITSNSFTNSTTGKYCSVALTLWPQTRISSHRPKCWNNIFSS